MGKYLHLLFVLTLTLVVPSVSGAWTTPFYISGADIDCSVPKVSRGASGKTHYAYRCKTGYWHILYTSRTANGAWGPVEQISQNGVWSERPDIIEDSSGRPNVIFTATGAGGANDLIWTYKNGGSWTTVNMTNTSSTHEDYPRLAIDSTGKIHLVYFKGSNGDTGQIVYRTLNGGSWSPESVIGSANTKVYYHRPDISVDSSNNVHVVWAESGTNLVYRKCTGGAWGPQITIGNTAGYWSYAKIAAVDSNKIVAVSFDQATSGGYELKYNTSTNGGSNWGNITYLNDGHYPNLDSYNGTAYLVYMAKPDKSGTGYRTWNGLWSTGSIITPAGLWQGWADTACATDGVVHTVYDEAGHIGYVSNSNTDTAGPDSASGLSLTLADSKVTLNWVNPSNADFKGTTIRYKTTGYPTGPNDGTSVYNQTSNTGASGSFTHSGLANGTRYYYAVFAYDYAGNYSTAALVSGTPSAGKPNLLSNGSMDSFSGGSASGWTVYKVNDPNNALAFGIDTSNVVSGSSQSITGLDSSNLPTSGKTSVGLYQPVSGVTPGKIYQFVGYQDFFSGSYNSNGHRYLHNFGINTSGGTAPGTPGIDGTIGGCKWMTPSQAFWNDFANASAPWFGGFHWTAASFPAQSTSITVWTGLTIDNTAVKDGLITKFNTDQCYLFEWDFPANTGLVNGDFEGGQIDLQDDAATSSGDIIPYGWIPAGGAIGQRLYNYWDVSYEAKRSGASGFRMRSRRGTVNAGIMQKIACTPGYSQTFSAWMKTSGQDNTVGYVGIDPYGGGDITSGNIVWQSTTSSTFTPVSVTAVSAGPAITVFLRTANVNTAATLYHHTDFDDCSYSQGSPVSVGRISGYVRDTSNSPVAGASVSTGSGGYTATTGTDGFYSLNNVLTGSYSVTASKSGFFSQTQDSILITTGGTTSCSFNLTVIPGSISGIVRDQDANPISNAVVETNIGGYSTVTGPDGSYDFDDITPGTYSLTVRKEGFQPFTSTSLVVTSGQALIIDFNLAPVVRSIPEAKALKDGSPVTITGCVVTAVFNGFFYIETPGRSSGMKVESPGTVTVGQVVTISGYIHTGAGERYITCNVPQTGGG